MDGRKATEKIRKLETDKIPIIAVSASIYDEERELVKSAGCDAFVAKPVTEEQIFSIMGKHLGVQFLYDEFDIAGSRKSLNKSAPQPVPELPSDILMKLKKAVDALDPEMIRQTIDEIRRIDPLIADTLSGFSDNYEYDKIISHVSCRPLFAVNKNPDKPSSSQKRLF